MEKLPCFLTEHFGMVSHAGAWCMLRLDIERCLSPCHSLGETDLRLLNLTALTHGINCL